MKKRGSINLHSCDHKEHCDEANKEEVEVDKTILSTCESNEDLVIEEIGESSSQLSESD